MGAFGKIGALGSYAQGLKADLDRLYSKEGKIVPPDLANAPTNLS
jgi:hypothetical protein